MQILHSFRNSIIVIALLAAGLATIWYTPQIPETLFWIAFTWAALVAVCVLGWDILQVIVNRPEPGEPAQWTEAPATVDKWAALKKRSESGENEAHFILSRDANKASARSRSDYDPTGPVTMD